jgi:PAS domain S-box-containing protein
VNQLPVIDSREYLILDRNFSIQEFSSLLAQYTEEFQNIAVGEDVRSYFPELVGLETICQAILQQKKDKFILQSVAREKDEDEILYFDICIQSLQNQLILLFDDVTELVKLRQSFVQKSNEVELTLSALKRFEYCTNKIIDSMGEILFITDASGAIERTNRAAEKVLNLSKSQLVNCSLWTIFKQQELNPADFYHFLVNNQKSVQKLEVSYLNKEQKKIEIEFNCFVIPTEIPNLYSCVYIGRDITLRKQAEQEMMQALEKEKELRQLKSRFLSMASHEFRNPLSSILVCTDMLCRGPETLSKEEQDFYLQLIKDSALNIQSILEDVLILSKAEAGKQTFSPTYLDFKEFCQQIIKEMQLSYDGRVINLIAPDNCVEIYGDAKLLWHILTNLLSNALKYSADEESVDLEIKEQESVIEIVICDRGIGIPLEAQKHLFESFYRASNVGEIPGTGLGLAIVKRAIDLHKGTIQIISQPDRGTRIELQLFKQTLD